MSSQWSTIKPSDILTRAEIRTLSRQSDRMGFALLAHAWGLIAACWLLYALLPNALTWLLAVILIGGRQLGLAILMHDGSHGMLFKSNKLNDRLTQWLTAWPVLIDLHAYRKRHMAHHRFTRTEKDPENFLYTPFPVSKASMGRKIVRDLTGIAFVRGQIGLLRFLWGDKAGRARRLARFYSGPLLANGVLLGASFLAGDWSYYFLLWLIPLATTQQLFLRIRNIAEHATVPSLDDPLRNSRTTLAGPFERLTVAPYWVNYHIEHHMMPFIPCYRLPLLHKLMLQKGYGPLMEIQPGYRDIIRINASA